MPHLFERSPSSGITRHARVGNGDLLDVIEELRRAPGGIKPSRFAAHAAHLLEMATERADDTMTWDIADGESDAIHWALERLVADGRNLSPDLHDLAEVVAN